MRGSPRPCGGRARAGPPGWAGVQKWISSARTDEILGGATGGTSAVALWSKPAANRSSARARPVQGGWHWWRVVAFSGVLERGRAAYGERDSPQQAQDWGTVTGRGNVRRRAGASAAFERVARRGGACTEVRSSRKHPSMAWVVSSPIVVVGSSLVQRRDDGILRSTGIIPSISLLSKANAFIKSVTFVLAAIS
jgi:hypothetical protein